MFNTGEGKKNALVFVYASVSLGNPIWFVLTHYGMVARYYDA